MDGLKYLRFLGSAVDLLFISTLGIIGLYLQFLGEGLASIIPLFGAGLKSGYNLGKWQEKLTSIFAEGTLSESDKLK